MDSSDYDGCRILQNDERDMIVSEDDRMRKDWYVVCLMPNFIVRLTEFPCFVGRRPPTGGNCIVIDEPFVSRLQFVLEVREEQVWYVNQSVTNPGLIDDSEAVELALDPDFVHLVCVGDLVLGIGTDVEAVYQEVLGCTPKALLKNNYYTKRCF